MPVQEAIKYSFNVAHIGFRRYFFFNRYYVEPVDGGHVAAFFGFVGARNVTWDQYGCLLPKRVLAEHRQRNLAYLGGVAKGKTEFDLNWRPVGQTPMESPTIMNLGYMDDLAEICLSGFAFAPLIRKASKTDLPVDPLVVLRSDLDLHRRVVEDIHLIGEEK